MKGKLGITIRMAIRSHSDKDMLRCAIQAGETLSFRLSGGVIDRCFAREVA